jgi:ATP-dependent exoDNAse (exonuclease V) beta subunit
MINFDAEHHRYTDSQGQEYLSVTQLLSRMFPFDKEKIAEKVIQNPNSRYFGMEKGDVLQEWADSASRGTEVHEAVEEWINTQATTENEVIAGLVEQFSNLKFAGPLHSEILVSDSSLRLAGTVDIVEERDDVCLVWDIKTSKAIGGDVLLKYSMQLEIYRRLVEMHFQKPTQVGGIIWFEDYVRRGGNTRLKIVEIGFCKPQVDSLLSERQRELAAGQNV